MKPAHPPHLMGKGLMPFVDFYFSTLHFKKFFIFICPTSHISHVRLASSVRTKPTPTSGITLSFFTNLICKVGILGEDFIWLSTSDRHSYVSYHKSCGDHFITIFANVFSWPHILKLAYFTNGSLSFNLNLWSRHPLCLRTYSSVHKWQILPFVSFRKT